MTSGDLRELVRYERGDELRIYNLSITEGVELWRVTEYPGEPPHTLKEADLRSIDELLELLEEIGRSLRAAGWRERSESA